jgi:hypothetical protein
LKLKTEVSLKKLHYSQPCLAVVSPSIREKRSWGATLIDEPGPEVGRPGNRFQSELESMGFSHKSGHALRKARIAEQPGTNGRETHIGSHCCFPILLLTCNRRYSLISLL